MTQQRGPEKKEARPTPEALSPPIPLIQPMLEFMDRLMQVESGDFYRLAVEFARQHLGIERGAIWIREGDWLRGTAGTDREGRTTDESSFRQPMDSIWQGLLQETDHPRWHLKESAPLFNWNGSEPVPYASGWLAATPILMQAERVAIFANDAGITGRPCNPAQQDLLVLFCGMLGQVMARREEELRRLTAEQLIQATLNALDQLVCVLDDRGIIVSVNTAWRQAAEQHGLRASGRICEGSDYLAACQRAAAEGDVLAGTFLRRMEELRSGHVSSFQLEYPCHQGEEQHWFMVRVTRIPEQPPLFVVAHTDISEIKRAGLLHEQRENQFRNVLSRLREVVFQADPEGRLSYLNPAWSEITGRPIEECLGLRLQDLLVAEDQARCAELMGQLLAGRTAVCQHESRFLTRDGGFRWMHVHARQTLDERGRQTGLAGTLGDITDRKATERLLEDRLHFFCSLFDCALDIISVIDEQGAIIYLNEAVHATLGYRLDELLGQPVVDLVHPDERETARAEITRVLQGQGDRASMTFRARHQDGGWRMLEAAANLLPTERGPRLVITARDVTDRHRNENLRVALDRLGEAARTAHTQGDLLAALQRIVGGLIPAENLFVALLDEESGLLTFPLWADQRDAQPAAHPPGRGLTEFVLTSRRTLRLNPENMPSFLAGAGVEAMGTLPVEWVGVPLHAEGRVLGALVVQSYQLERALGPFAQTVLEVLATPLALALGGLAHAKARAESDQHYRTLFTEMPSAFWVVEILADERGQPVDARLVELNEAMAHLLQQPRQDLLGRRISDILPGHPRPWFDTMAAVSRTGEPAHMEWTSQWIKRDLVVYAYRPQPGQVACVVDDVTERMQAERALRRRDALLEAIAFSAERFLRTPDWEHCAQAVLGALGRAAEADRVYIFQNEPQPDGRMLTSQRYEWVADGVAPQIDNPLLQQCDPVELGLTEWSAELARDRIVSGLVSEFNLDQQRLFAHQGVQSVMLVPIFSNGQLWGFIGLDDCRQERVWMASEKDAVRSIAQTLGEVIQRRRAEEAMRVRSAAVASAANGIVITDARGHIIFVNQAFQQLTGYTEGEVLGHTPSLLKSGVHDAAFYLDMWQHMKDGTVWRGEITNRRKDGRLYQEEMTITPVRNPGGKVTHFIAIKQDITERRNLQQQLQQAQKMESIGRLAGGIAHDFNNLLQAITGFSSILMDELGEGDPRRSDVEEIDRAAQRAVALTRQLLAFSRKQKLEMVPLDLNRELAGTEKMLRRLIGENIALETDLAEGLPGLLGDPGHLEQVVVNLAVNARDAMPEGGRLILRTRGVSLEREARPEPAGSGSGRYLQLSIIDTGTGMTPEVRERIFEPFFSTKGSGKGTGLGLAVVYGIVRQHGGFIEVQTEPGQGTTFSVFLPALDPSAVAPAPAKAILPAAGVDGNGERILVVEDEDGVREFALRILTDHRYKVAAAATCEEARTRMREEGPFAVLLSDVVLPDGNGIRLADELTAAQPGLPVLLCSAYSDEQAHSDIIQSRGYRFLSKPYPVAGLLRELNALLHRDPSS